MAKLLVFLGVSISIALIISMLTSKTKVPTVKSDGVEVVCVEGYKYIIVDRVAVVQMLSTDYYPDRPPQPVECN